MLQFAQHMHKQKPRCEAYSGKNKHISKYSIQIPTFFFVLISNFILFNFRIKFEL